MTAPHPPARVLGFWSAVAIVIGNMIGSGVFLLPASLAAYRGLSLAGWALSAAGSIMLALVFARLARSFPAAGGPYAYTRAAFGDLPGFLVGWGYFFSIISTLPALAVAFVGYLDPFVPALVRSPISAAMLAILAIWVMVGVNIAGVRTAGRVQVVTTVLKILPLALVGLGGLFFVTGDVFALPDTRETPMPQQLIATVTLTLWAFLGLECATIPAGSVRDPGRTIARATVVGTLLAAAIYIVSTVGVMSLVAADTLARSTAPFAEAAQRLLGTGAGQLVALGAAVSCFGALNGWVLIAGQFPMAIAQDGLFPAVFGRLSPRGTPARGMVVAGVLGSALVAMNYSRGLVDLFTFIILLATLSTLVPYVFCSMAVWLMPQSVAGDRQSPDAKRRTRLGGGAAVISALAFIYSMFAIGGAGAEAVFYGFLWLLAGLPVYVWVQRDRETRAAAADRDPISVEHDGADGRAATVSTSPIAP